MNRSYKHLPRTPVGNNAMNVNLIICINQTAFRKKIIFANIYCLDFHQFDVKLCAVEANCPFAMSIPHIPHFILPIQHVSH